ncbi:stage II sporulation protein M [Amorphoplanes digitatis]|uniref:Putative membrane protein SpoIIM required for sporulation n=1 Tax=Actinoplanes digitatis TaxID=1868 RepID=A0A7W7I3H5_9ACTN|nr:stage II sporulation protein M [Actinoplanes digitatis]MBB4765747.1 putative membrane protein SpoIIM required for sporulation [Actinoplanes digitatis]GID93461.1 membrane protein [Actinoplanes digitatis]
MDLDAYVAERRGEWNRLEVLARRRRLSPDEADELVLLYQRAATHLSVVRSHSPDPVLLALLSQLVIAGRSAVTGGRRFSWRPVARFFTSSFPAQLYVARHWWLSVMVVNVLAGWALMWYFSTNPDIISSFASGEALREYVEDDFVGYYSEFQAQNFAASVWSHNALIAAQCLASGVLILPVLYILGQNLFAIGMTGGMMIYAGHGGTFFAMILPHGLLELTSIFVAAGVGLRIGWAWIAPGPHRTRGQALAERARAAMLVALGLVVMLGVSGVLEAYVTPSGLPDAVRIGIGAAVWLAFMVYALGVGGAAHRAGETGALAPEHDVTPVPTA